jgi:hypothetical protein
MKIKVNHELRKLYNEAESDQRRVGRLRWLGRLFRTQEQNTCRKLTLHQPEGTQQVGTPAVSGWIQLNMIRRQQALEIGEEHHRIGTNGKQS